MFALGCGAVIAACTSNPSIDGSQVAPIVNPDCAQACKRLAALCGYAPTGDLCTTPAGDGYCDTQFDTDHLACVGQAASCQDAWDCTNAEAPADDAGDGAATDDAATE
jgi:hypothetical protein